MTTPGPKPKPTAIRVFEGNAGNVPLNEHEPKPEKCESNQVPSWLDVNCDYMLAEKFSIPDVAKMIWSELFPQLDRLGVITAVDTGKFGRYCEIFARWLKCKAFIDKHGETYPVYGGQYEPVYDKESGTQVIGADGKPKHEFKKHLKQMRQFPQVGTYLKLGEALGRYEGEFGIGAASRTRIQAVVETPFGPGVQDDDHDFNYHRKRSKLKVA